MVMSLVRVRIVVTCNRSIVQVRSVKANLHTVQEGIVQVVLHSPNGE